MSMSMSMSISEDSFPTEEDYPHEEDVLRNPNSVMAWWRYLVARSSFPFQKRVVIYERALRALPGSYKLWHAYLRELLQIVSNLPITHPQYETLNNTFERALATMHKMPRIWTMYLEFLTHQKLITRARRTADRALCALPLTHHDRIWERYLILVSGKGVPVETSLRVYRRYLMYDPSGIENYIDFLVHSELWQEATERLAGVLTDDHFCSVKGKNKQTLWLELCGLFIRHAASEISIWANVDAIMRGGIRKFRDEVGRLWTSLADYYIRRGLFDKARDVFEEGITTVITVRDFSLIFDAYAEFEESILSIKLETLDDGDEKEEGDKLDMEKVKKSIDRFWLNDCNDVDLQLARLEHLMERRAGILTMWSNGIGELSFLKGTHPTKQILTYAEAVRTVDPAKALGKPHTLWVAFAKLYESHGDDVSNARVILDKAVQVDYKAVDHLASVWCEWAEMELRHKNFEGALQLMRRAAAEPSAEVKRRVAADGYEPAQMKLHKSLRLWTFYVDLEESLGTLESTRVLYEKILDLKIATPQIIINYAHLLEENSYFEDSCKVYERGVKIFHYPHVKDIWVTYLSKFVARYGRSKMERAREMFCKAVEEAPAKVVKHFYLKYARFEEEFGLAKNAMRVYDEAAKAVSPDEKLGIYEVYIERASHMFGIAKTRRIYEQAIESLMQGNDVKIVCVRYADLETKLGEIDRSRALYKHASQFADPRCDAEFWKKWHEFEVHNGNEDTFREMLRTKRSVSASCCQVTIDEASQLLHPTANYEGDAGLQQTATTRREEEIELPQETESEYDEKVEETAETETERDERYASETQGVGVGVVRKRDEDHQTATGEQGIGGGGLDSTRIKRMRLNHL